MAAGHKRRVRARRCAVQALYQWLVAGDSPHDIVAQFVADRELHNVDMKYFSKLAQEVPAKYDELVSDISVAIDREWSRIDTIERAILLIGAYELRYCPQIPWRVVLNESIDLGKMFGAQDAHRFINGVLDKLSQARRGEDTIAP